MEQPGVGEKEQAVLEQAGITSVRSSPWIQSPSRRRGNCGKSRVGCLHVDPGCELTRTTEFYLTLKNFHVDSDNQSEEVYRNRVRRGTPRQERAEKLGVHTERLSLDEPPSEQRVTNLTN